jgi:uncharacterized FlaG/YvyC family protein
MSEEISTTGQFPAVNSAASATPHLTPNSASRQTVSATPAVQTANEFTAAATSAVTAASQPAEQASADEISTAVAASNANLSSSNRKLDYRVDAVTGISIATIRNSVTGVVVQQMPGADIIALARMLADWSPGKHMLFDLIA